MHLMATYLPVLIDCAFSTSENVPSPFLEINLYSIGPKLKCGQINIFITIIQIGILYEEYIYHIQSSVT